MPARRPPPAAPPLALVRRFPSLADRLPRYPLTTLPTPVHRLERLARRAGIDELWIKRDDRSAAVYGGNKPRKLELVLGEALARRRRRVLTFGGIGSHHALATTLAARAAGLRTQLVLIPQPVTPHVRRTLLLDHAFGAELHLAGGIAGTAATALRLLARGTLAGDRPFVIPPGGTSVAGTLAYVSAALELAEQVRAGALPAPDTIFVALGTGGTAAGLWLGLRLAGLETRVVAVLVTDILPPSARRLAARARAAHARLRRLAPEVPALRPSSATLRVERAYVGGGYGVASPAAEEARALIAAEEDVAIETTYTAKCLAAVLAAARGGAGRGARWLFWNTFSAVDPAAALDTLPDPATLPIAFHRFFAVGA